MSKKRDYHTATKEGQTYRCTEQPVTLLNVDYKIATKVVANKLAKVLPDIICPNQTDYVKNRYIGENACETLIADKIHYIKTKETQGVALFLDSSHSG